VVQLLLQSGADPNLPDEYTNIYHTARDKGLHSLDVMVAREDEFSSRLAKFTGQIFVFKSASFLASTNGFLKMVV
jgi:hypothetical protein